MPDKHRDPFAVQLVLAGLSAGTSVVITNPIDVVKCRLQLQSAIQRNSAAAVGHVQQVPNSQTSQFITTSAPPATKNTTRPMGNHIKATGNSASASAALESKPHYTGFLNAFRTIATQEGIAPFYSGLGPALWRVAAYSSVRMGLYEPLRDTFSQYYHAVFATSQPSSSHPDHVPTSSPSTTPSTTTTTTTTTTTAAAAATAPVTSLSSSSSLPPPPPFFIKISAAITSGAIAAAFGNPFELVKVRMQALQHKHVYNSGTAQALKSIVQSEGLRGLWRGVGAGIGRASVLTVSQLAVYDEAKSMVKNYTMGEIQEGPILHFGAALLSGLITTTLGNPFDVVKTTMMATKNAKATYANSWQCLSYIVQTEGIRGLFKGWTPNYVRLGPQTVITLIVYEQLRLMAGFSHL